MHQKYRPRSLTIFRRVMRLRTNGASHDVPGESPLINLELVKRESQELSLRRGAEVCDAGFARAWRTDRCERLVIRRVVADFDVQVHVAGYDRREHKLV